jgi:WD40 repeat protein
MAWVKGSGVAVGLLLAVAAGLGLYSRQAWEEQQIAVAVTKLERDGAAAVEQTKKRHLDGLLSAMRSGEELQQLMQRKRTSEYLAASPVYALQQALETTEGQTMLGHPTAIVAMTVTPKGDQVITVGADSVVRIWDTAGNLTTSSSFKADNRAPRKVEFSPSGDRILISLENGSKKVFDVSGKLIKELDQSYDEIIFSPTGNRISATFCEQANTDYFNCADEYAKTKIGSPF